MNTKMMFARSVKGLPSTIFLVLLMTRRMMPISELVVWSDSNDDDVRKALRVLEGMQVIAVDIRDRGEKWYGLANGYQEMLPGMFAAIDDGSKGLISESDLSDSEIVEGSFSANPGADKSDSEILENKFEQKIPEKVLETGDFEEKTGSGADKSDSDPLVKLSKLKDSSIKNPLTNLTSEIAQKTSVKKLCDFSHLLFGKSVFCDQQVASRDIDEVLAWMAQTYDLRDEISRPWGIVYRGLRREIKRKGTVMPDERPARQYFDDPFAYLPENYLQAVGLDEYIQVRCEFCGGTGTRHHEGCHILRQAALQASYDPDFDTPRQVIVERELRREHKAVLSVELANAWQAAMISIKAEMPKASFDTWIADCNPVEERDQILFVSVRNAYARDWVSERMTDKFIELLADAGITKVVFITIDDFLRLEITDDTAL